MCESGAERARTQTRGEEKEKWITSLLQIYAWNVCGVWVCVCVFALCGREREITDTS